MNTLVAIQNATFWLLLAGAMLLMVGLISKHWIEKSPRMLDTVLFWIAGVLLAMGVLAFVAPYVVIFFGARAI